MMERDGILNVRNVDGEVLLGLRWLSSTYIDVTTLDEMFDDSPSSGVTA